MGDILQTVLVATAADERRFESLLRGWIASGELEALPGFTEESEASKKKRRRAAAKEAREAEEYAAVLAEKRKPGRPGETDDGRAASKKGKGAHGSMARAGVAGGEEMDLVAQFQQNKARRAGFLDDLEAKYAAEARAKSAKRNKREGGSKNRARPLVQEPTEEEFAALQAKLFGDK